MRISEAWLREWVDPPVSTKELIAQLTNAGLEVDSVEPVAPPLDGIVVADVITVAPHPDAERLSVCEVSLGGPERLSVVCGAPNVREGMRSAYAPVGSRIGDGTKIRRSRIRGVESHGMLCSPRELGLGESQDGIIELPLDAPVGAALASYLSLSDVAIELELTPNRGECLGIAGIAREVGAINRCEVRVPEIPLVKSTINDRFPVALEAPADCPRYVGRVISGIDPEVATPMWMQERLRRSGVRSIGAVVDISNYVMIELGQPMHAFDRGRLEGGIRVRKAVAGETLLLLDGRTVTLDPSTLVIADERKAVALAGIMGGLDTAVTSASTEIFLESAFFAPLSLIGQARRYGLHTDASHRFERGVDPELQRRAAERATQLLLDIVGGEAGPIVDEVSAVNMPRRASIHLRPARIKRLLGLEVEAETVTGILERLGMVVQAAGEGWSVIPPSYRFDVAMEADLIEEIARLIGYDAIPSVGLSTPGIAPAVPEGEVGTAEIRRTLVERGYHEAVTYSFVDPEMQRLLDPEVAPVPLANPLSSELAVMRTSLWPGLVQALVHNIHRQQPRVRLFESGLVFKRRAEGNEPRVGFNQVGDLSQVKCLAGIVTGSPLPEQWDVRPREIDFFDVKADVEALLALAGGLDHFTVEPAGHPALHPGQSAVVRGGGREVGLLGALSPRVAAALKLGAPVYLFQLEADVLGRRAVPRYAPVSKFPAVRRDIAVVLDEAVPAAAVRRCVGQVSPDVLKNLEFFDVYRGEGIDPGKKSLAIGLTFQAASRTLNDDEIERFVDRIVTALVGELGGVLRG